MGSRLYLTQKKSLLVEDDWIVLYNLCLYFMEEAKGYNPRAKVCLMMKIQETPLYLLGYV